MTGEGSSPKTSVWFCQCHSTVLHTHLDLITSTKTGNFPSDQCAFGYRGALDRKALTRCFFRSVVSRVGCADPKGSVYHCQRIRGYICVMDTLKFTILVSKEIMFC